MVKDYNAPKDANTFIAKGSEFVGKLTFEGTVVIDGKADGEIFSKGTLIIGPSGDIKAKINVETVVLSGTVNGNIYAAKKIEMLPLEEAACGARRTPVLFVNHGITDEEQPAASHHHRRMSRFPSRPLHHRFPGQMHRPVERREDHDRTQPGSLRRSPPPGPLQAKGLGQAVVRSDESGKKPDAQNAQETIPCCHENPAQIGPTTNPVEMCQGFD